MTLEGLADLIRANSASTNGRIDRMVEDLRGTIDARHAESYGAILNIQNDLTDVRGGIKGLQGDVGELKTDMAEVKGEVAEVRRNLDLATTVAALRRQLDEFAAEVAELKRRAS
jgi:chromosome segregation ATPase